MTCPCPCGQPVKPGNTYSGKGCFARAHRDVMGARGRIGGKKSRPPFLRTDDYDKGYRSGFSSGYRRGYARAYEKWKRWAELHVRRVA